MRELATVIQEWIDKQPGRTIADLSREAGVSPTTLGNIVKLRNKRVTPDTLNKIVKVTGQARRLADAMPEPDITDPLSALIATTMRKHGLSYRKVAKAAAEAGHPITPAAINNIVTGETRKPSRQTLETVVLGINRAAKKRLLTVDQLEVAYDQSERMVRYELPERAKHLTADQYEALIKVMDTLLGQRRRS